jgi:ribonucleotide reductase beta subunit family protein with ferritin-like domain
MKIEIYSKKGCPSCDKAKKFFETHDIEFLEKKFNLKKDRLKMYDSLSRELGKEISSVPQIFIDGKHIGGYTSLMVKSSDILKEKMSMLESSIAFKPFRYPWAVSLFEIHEAMHWIKDEVEMDEDVSDWNIKGVLTESEKRFITSVLRMFTQSDVQVGANYYDQFLPRIKANELRNMLGSFAAREGIHQNAYALLNDTLGFPDSEYHSFLDYKEMCDKIDLMSSGNPTTHSGLALCMARSVFNEGLMLFASFAALFNFERFGKMKGMCKIVEWSVRDEGVHVQGISRMFRDFCKEKPRIVNDNFKKKIYDMARETVEAEDKFIELLFKNNDIEGLNKKDMKRYIRYIADRRLLQLGLKPEFGVKDNPLEWMETLLVGINHQNFFEGKSSDYEVSGSTGKYTYDYVSQGFRAA